MPRGRRKPRSGSRSRQSATFEPRAALNVQCSGMQALGASLIRGAAASALPRGLRAAAADTVLGRQINATLAYEHQRYGQSLLKKGILGMARRAGVPQGMMRELQNLDELTLQQMYASGSFDFETFFKYESHGGSNEKGIINLTQMNTAEFDRFLAAYRAWSH